MSARSRRPRGGLAIAALTVVALAPAARAGDAPFAVLSPDALAARLHDDDVTVLDVRTSVADYQHGHVPGAVFLANDTLRAPRGGVPVQFLDPDAMADLFNRAGVQRDDLVVVYADGKAVLGATMVAYALERIGHRRTAILDGGLEAYRLRHPLDQAYPPAAVGDLSPELDRSILVTVDALRDMLARPGVTVLDTRPAADYLGNTTRWMRNGHIPGAINLDWRTLMQPRRPHAFRPADELRRLVTEAGVRPEDEVIVYCGTSREATLVRQVLRHVLGFPRVRLYEGSWTEWCSMPELPVERAAPDRAATVAHRPPTTDRLEPYACGSVARMHTMNGVFLASQPAVADLEQASLGGIRTVINQRHDRENTAFDERQVVTALGMTYHHVPFNGPDELTETLLDETRALLRTAERPLLLHCSSANRSGAVWAAYRALDEGLAWDDALAEAKTIGLRSRAYERIVRDYVERHLRSATADVTAPVSLEAALLTALDDERSAEAFYVAVIDRFGPRRPISNIARAERRHAAAIISLLEARGFAVPPNAHGPEEVMVPAAYGDAVRAAIAAEESNVAMYDELLTAIDDAEARSVLVALRGASQQRHIPALRRFLGD